MKRRVPLPRSRKPLARRTRPRAKGKPRFKVSGQPDEAKRAWIRAKACLVCGWVPSEPAHAKARGASGTDEELVPLCGPDYRHWREGHHAQQHRIGMRSFERLHSKRLKGKTLREHAAAFHALYLAQRAGVPTEGRS